MTSGYRVAADVGGTFTDIAFVSPEGAVVTEKVPSTPADYAEAIIDGIEKLVTQTGASVGQVSEILHGCTVATNAILEKTGPKTALITTKGFGDVLEMRRIRIPRLYDPLYVKPEPLVPRHLRFEVEERLGPNGEVVTPLNVGDVREAVGRIKEAQAGAVAVAFLHSYANPEHERQVGDILRREFPRLFVTLSSEVVPEIREYERTSTTVVNAYVGPPVEAYLKSLVRRLEGTGFKGHVRIMQSSGGILDVGNVLKKPCQIIECGPAAGVIGCAHLGKLAGYPNVISLDMGGTTAKASIIENGQITRADEYEVGSGISLSSRLVQGGGYALKTPVIDIAEVGAGGGSIVWLDKAGSLKVGPRSAGAVPGPACYGSGGDQPTVTDANLVLGYLGPSGLAGGTLTLDRERARAAIDEKIAKPMGRDLHEASFGARVVANANMMRAIKAVSSYRGRNPKDFVMFAFGGSGPMHAAELARELEIGRVVVPPAAGVFSALGLLLADMTYSHSRAFPGEVSGLSPGAVEQAFRALEEDVVAHMGFERGQVALRRHADLRYKGQAFELPIAVRSAGITEGEIREIGRRFEDEHESTYGYRFPNGHAVEMVSLGVTGLVIPEGKQALNPNAIRRPSAHSAPMETSRRAYFGPEFGFLEPPVVRRIDLLKGTRRGPLIIEEKEATVVVPPYAEAELDDWGSIVLRIDGTR